MSPGLSATFFLLATHDLLEKALRDNTHADAEYALEYGRDITPAWRQAVENFKKSDGFETLSPDLDKAIDAIIARLSGFSSLSDDAAFLRQRHLEKVLPQTETAPVAAPACRACHPAEPVLGDLAGLG